MSEVNLRLGAAPCDLQDSDSNAGAREALLQQGDAQGANSSSAPRRTVTAKDWLLGMLQGKDIMADSDSPITKRGLSGLVWKSMGAWRMQQDGRVYLECRRSSLCIAREGWNNDALESEIARVARWMQRFERG